MALPRKGARDQQILDSLYAAMDKIRDASGDVHDAADAAAFSFRDRTHESLAQVRGNLQAIEREIATLRITLGQAERKGATSA